jgi:23S rRNA (uridine2552-2'-O)-methyltransferase
VAAGKAGKEGFVLGVDLQPIAKLPRENVKTLLADITDKSTLEIIKNHLPRPADVVLSDASPKITGVWTVDHSRSLELARAALSTAKGVLKPGGTALVKVFQGDFFGEFVREVEEEFEFVKVSKPKASRKGSAEIYLVAKGFKSERLRS